MSEPDDVDEEALMTVMGAIDVISQALGHSVGVLVMAFSPAGKLTLHVGGIEDGYANCMAELGRRVVSQLSEGQHSDLFDDISKKEGMH